MRLNASRTAAKASKSELVDRLAVLDPLPELGGLAGELVVGELSNSGSSVPM